jgi:hypothetical protein
MNFKKGGNSMGYSLIRNRTIFMGCDPEFFFRKEGNIIGAEKVISKQGIVNTEGKVIIDGVQAELNPSPSYCREILAGNIRNCFTRLNELIKNNKEGIKVDFSGIIEVNKEEFDSLSDDSKKFGCEPDYNIYAHKVNEVKVNPKKYMKRSAGGHIHLGLQGGELIEKNHERNLVSFLQSEITLVNKKVKGLSIHELEDGKDIKENELVKYYDMGKVKFDNMATTLKKIDRLIPMLDIIVGNTCVLIDRNKLAPERRKVYGRAGDYRLPPYGIEYRTLSNFWLQAYPLMSFVFGLSRLAFNIICDSICNINDVEKQILDAVNLKDIQKAINENDYKLAYKNFKKIKPVLEKHCSLDDTLNSSNIIDFEYFITKPLDYWFKENPLEHWLKHNNGESGRNRGWERFLSEVVRPERLSEES